MQTLIEEGFIGNDIDQEIQKNNLVKFKSNVNLFYECIFEIAKPHNIETNNELAKQFIPYLNAITDHIHSPVDVFRTNIQAYNYYTAKEELKYESNPSVAEYFNYYYNNTDILLNINDVDKNRTIKDFIQTKIASIKKQLDEQLSSYDMNNYSIKKTKDLYNVEDASSYQNIASEVKKANNSTTQNSLNNIQETTVLGFLKEKYSNFNKDNDKRRKEFFKFVNDVIIKNQKLPPFTHEDEIDDGNDIDALSPYLTFISQYNEANGVSIKGGFMEPDKFTYFNKTEQCPINIFINDFINGKEYLEINQAALESLKKVFNNNTALNALTLESYYKNALDHNISQVNGFFNHAKKNQYIDQIIKIISDYLEIKGMPKNDQDNTIITELETLKNANSFKKFLDALNEFFQSIFGKDRVTRWKDVVTTNDISQKKAHDLS